MTNCGGVKCEGHIRWCFLKAEQQDIFSRSVVCAWPFGAVLQQLLVLNSCAFSVIVGVACSHAHPVVTSAVCLTFTW